MKSEFLKEHEIEYWLEPRSAIKNKPVNLDEILNKMDSLSPQELRECFYLYNCDINAYIMDRDESR